MKRGLLILIFCGVFLLNGCAAARTAFSADPREIDLPIAMYHSVLPEASRAGEYVVTPEVIERDLRELMRRGYETVTFCDVLAFVEEGADLPAHPVMITFDDGHTNVMRYVLPILEELDQRAVMFVVGSYAEWFSGREDCGADYAYLNWQQLTELSETGRFEIQAHSYAMHELSPRKGTGKMPGESEEAYRAAFCTDTELLLHALRENCGILPTAFAYPFGIAEKSTTEYLRMLGIRASVTCYECRNTVRRGEPEDLYFLGRHNRPASLSTDAFLRKLLNEKNG